jgi:hypothetical protein
MTKRKARPVGEVLAELNADPRYVAMKREQEQTRQEQADELRRAEAPLVEALTKAGVHVQSAWDLINRASSCPQALPVLLEHLEKPYPVRVREGIARALAVPESISAWPTLLRLFEAEVETTTTGVKFALGCALAAAATDNVIGDVIRLVRDGRHGANRAMLVRSLAKSADPRARQALMDVAADPELGTEAQKALKRFDRKKVVRMKPAGSKPPGKARELAETSMNLNAPQVEPFIKRVAALVSGLGQREVAQVTHLVDALEVDEEGELLFEVRHAAHTVPLRVVVVMDDIDAPNLYFFTVPELVKEIETLMKDFGEEHGM